MKAGFLIAGAVAASLTAGSVSSCTDATASDELRYGYPDI